jgi:hypothetical protein
LRHQQLEVEAAFAFAHALTVPHITPTPATLPEYLPDTAGT